MIDKETTEGLIARVNRITENSLFARCLPLFCSTIQKNVQLCGETQWMREHIACLSHGQQGHKTKER